MRIGVMGAGGVGAYFGAKLAQGGYDVVFVARGEHLSRMKFDGLRVRSIDGDFDMIPRAVGSPEEAGECDLILFCVKSYDTEVCARAIAPMLKKDTVILSLQNGVDNEERLARILGSERIIGGLCYIGARIENPGEVIHSAAGRVIIGEFDGRKTIRLARIEAAFRDAGVTVDVSGDIALDQWKKLCWNISFNSISALARATVGEILSNHATRETARAAMAEAVSVGNAHGVKLDESLPETIIATNAQYAKLRTSMLQDVERGARLEAEALNGVVCRYGEEAGIATPVNSTLYGLLSCLGETLAK